VLPAVSVTVCGVFCTEKDEGATVSPEGKPEIVIATAPLNPLLGVIETWKVDDVPGAIEGDDGVATIVKDAGGGPCTFDPPPQLARFTPNQRPTQIEMLIATQRPVLAG
jgi:hypothetical protein